MTVAAGAYTYPSLNGKRHGDCANVRMRHVERQEKDSRDGVQHARLDDHPNNSVETSPRAASHFARNVPDSSSDQTSDAEVAADGECQAGNHPLIGTEELGGFFRRNGPDDHNSNS